jgi:GGDEF domain-containing protein
LLHTAPEAALGASGSAAGAISERGCCDSGRARANEIAGGLQTIPGGRLRAESDSGAGGEKLSITVSLGGASMQVEDTSPEQALERADKNLYRAKEAGRNRVDLG